MIFDGTVEWPGSRWGYIEKQDWPSYRLDGSIAYHLYRIERFSLSLAQYFVQILAYHY